VIYLITVNYYSSSLIAQLMDSLSDTPASDRQLIIINNSPDDDSIDDLKSESTIILHAGTNLGFGRACNLGLQWVYQRNSEAIVWLINPDSYLLENTLARATRFFSAYPELSILGTLVYEPTGKIWFGEGEFVPETGEIVVRNRMPDDLLPSSEKRDRMPDDLLPSSEKRDRMPDDLSPHSEKAYTIAKWVTGCSLLINFKHFSEVPQFDPDYFLYYEDFDFCQRYARQGHLIGLTGQLKVIHQPSSIAGRNQNLKLRNSIYSYLLTLEKHASQSVLWMRLLRIAMAAAIALPIQPQRALNKWQAIFLYGQRALNQSIQQRARGRGQKAEGRKQKGKV